eukprot:SAG25_NODE_66_length_17563_cov_34.737918_7_plen_69_part_00
MHLSVCRYIRSGTEYDINCRCASQEEDAVNRKLLFTKKTANGQRQPGDLMVCHFCTSYFMIDRNVIYF